ncbi:MAG: 4Fe-4S binding protein [Planctomycetes bacterium]|nr:4Fe-4S binding protein [Planctomycetota bacterium]
MSAQGFLESVGGPPVRIDDTLCSRYRSTKSGCSACLDACPIPGALDAANGGIRVQDPCVGCGACLSACPNGALKGEIGDRSLAARMRLTVRQGSPYRIACDRVDGARWAQESGAAPDLVLPCLSRATEALLLEPVRLGARRIELLVPGCEDCPLARAAAQWRRTVDLARSLAAGLGIRDVEYSVADAPRLIPDDTDPVRPETGPRVSRRDALHALFRRGRAAAAGALAPAEPAKTPAEVFRENVRRHPENAKRTHLLEIVAALAPGSTGSAPFPREGTPFAELDVNERCVGCDVCETLCPVGAIRRKTEGASFALEFEPGLCTGCGICAQACLFRAIHLRTTFDPTLLARRGWTTVFEAEKTRCRICGVECVGRASDVCRLCELQSRRQKAFARQLFSGGNGRGSR